MRRFLRHVGWICLESFILLCTSCAHSIIAPIDSPKAPTDSAYVATDPVIPDSIAYVDIDSALVAFFADQRTTHSVEQASCLYGLVIGDTVVVTMLRPVDVQTATASMITYKPCRKPQSLLFGKIRYLGMHHIHLPVGVCWFSAPDTESFMYDAEAVLDALTCSEGIVVRAKHPKGTQ